MFCYKIVGTDPLSSAHINAKFPFRRMNVGESFMMYREECTAKEIAQMRKAVIWFNNKYRCYFGVYKHRYHPEALEVVRLG